MEETGSRTEKPHRDIRAALTHPKSASLGGIKEQDSPCTFPCPEERKGKGKNRQGEELKSRGTMTSRPGFMTAAATDRQTTHRRTEAFSCVSPKACPLCQGPPTGRHPPGRTPTQQTRARRWEGAGQSRAGSWGLVCWASWPHWAR